MVIEILYGKTDMSKGEIKRLGVQLTGAVFVNNKTGDHYKVLSVGMNSTNAQDGLTMIRYQRFFSGELIGIEFFRDHEEFVKKFTILDK